MKKNFTFKKSLLVAAMAFAAVTAQAQKYTPLWGQLKAYPAEAGKVYAEMSALGVAPENANYAEPTDVVDVKFAYSYSAKGNYKGYAVPNEGWAFAGFATQKYEDGEAVMPTEVEWTDNPRVLPVASQKYSKAELTKEEALANFPNEPDEVHYALFTRVTVSAEAPYYVKFGSATIDKVANDIGQQITITAVPNEDAKAKFSHWVEESTGKEITDNPYTLVVSGIENYKAVFTSDNVFTIDFPEEGGYVEFYRENEINFLETVEHPIFMKDNVKKYNDEIGFFNEVDKYRTFIDPQIPTFFYGKGTQTFLDVPTNTKAGNHNGLEKWSGEEGIDLSAYRITIDIGDFWEPKDTVVTDVNGYLLNTEKNVFERVTDGKVPAKRVFLALPKYFLDQIEEGFVPDMIYLTEEEAEAAGVNGVQVDKPVKNGKTYTLDGKQVTSPKQKGVYIYDGKKLIFRK